MTEKLDYAALEARRHEEVTGGLFEDNLRRFVRLYAPQDVRELHDFHMALIRIMMLAMRHQTTTLGTALTTATMLHDATIERSLWPLRVVPQERADAKGNPQAD